MRPKQDIIIHIGIRIEIHTHNNTVILDGISSNMNRHICNIIILYIHKPLSVIISNPAIDNINAYAYQYIYNEALKYFNIKELHQIYPHLSIILLNYDILPREHYKHLYVYRRFSITNHTLVITLTYPNKLKIITNGLIIDTSYKQAHQTLKHIIHGDTIHVVEDTANAISMTYLEKIQIELDSPLIDTIMELQTTHTWNLK